MTENRRKQLELLSSAQLKSILQAELVSKETDIELIKCVNEILDEREGPIEFDVDAAWEELMQVYADSEPLYSVTDVDDAAEEVEHSPKKKSHPLAHRMFPIVAALVIFMASLVTVQALGIDIFGIMARWTSEVFHFADTAIPYAVVQTNPLAEGEVKVYDTLQEAVDDFGIDVPLVPTVLPERFGSPEITATTTDGRVSIRAVYRANGDYLRISFVEVAVKDFGVTEKNVDTVKDVFLMGIHHYITVDENRMKATWKNGELECHIFGNITSQELEDAVKSIYEVEVR